MKLSTREQNLLWIILVFLIGFLVYNYSYTPLQEEIEALKSKSSELEFEVEKLEGIELLIDTTKKEIVEFTNRLQNDHNDIPDNWDQAELLYHVEGIVPDIVTRKNINLRLNDDEEIEVASGFVNLELISEYEEFKEILDLFEKSKYLNELTNISIITEKDQDGFNTENLEINLTYMFYNKDKVSFYTDYEFMDGKYSKPDIFK